jgi:hypothetical protein
MCEVRITSIYLSGTNHPEWWFSGLHDTNLNRRGMSSQDLVRTNIKGIVHSPGWMVRRYIKGFEIIVVVF